MLTTENKRVLTFGDLIAAIKERQAGGSTPAPVKATPP